MQITQIGLLFVHGIGEQKRFEFLKATVLQIAELMQRSGSEARISIIDRTGDWKLPPGQPDPNGMSPITVTWESNGQCAQYHCCEAWWADLGSRSGIFDQILFWIWGLGQWSAPIYRELDAAGLPKREINLRTVSDFVRLPQSVSGYFLQECWARFRLLVAAIAAVFVLVTWSLAKRIFAFLLGQAPGPTLIVQYVGDVHTYESRGAPGDTCLSDPGLPRRVGIRRRMVAEMVTMGGNPQLDRWYVIAHSLGTVVAYNGLTETGQALPNYLDEQQWRQVPAALKGDPGCRLRDDVAAMMPARPPWLSKYDVIDRPALFRNLHGFLTFGSPLEKFAALWPRIVATADDRSDGVSPLAKCQWVNLVAPQDPVAGVLNRFRQGAFPLLPATSVPQIAERLSYWNPAYVLAHILYFSGVDVFDTSTRAVQKISIAKWLLGIGPPNSIPTGPDRRSLGFVFYPLIIAAVWLAAAALWGLGASAASGVSSAFGISIDGSSTSGGVLVRALTSLPTVANIALSAVLACGVWRWFREAELNLEMTKRDNLRPELQRFLTLQLFGAAVLLSVSVPICMIGLVTESRAEFRWAVLLVSLLALSIAVQSLVNWTARMS